MINSEFVGNTKNRTRLAVYFNIGAGCISQYQSRLYNLLTWTQNICNRQIMMMDRSRLQPYIRPLDGVSFITPGPDGNRALVPHLLGVTLKSVTSKLSGSTRAGLTYTAIISLSSAIYKISDFVLLYSLTYTLSQTGCKYCSSFAIKAHKTRAFLFANATAARLMPRRFFRLVSQRLFWSFFVSHLNATERAP